MRELLHRVATTTEKHRVERLLAKGITEWWRSEDRGFEFGWDVATMPTGEGELLLKAAVECPWPGAVESSGADSWGRVSRLTAPSPAPGMLFGLAVAVDGADLGVGAPRESRGGVALAGAVYLFSTGHPNYDVWTFDSRLQPDESVGGRSEAGAVYVFRKRAPVTGGWSMEQRLTDPAGNLQSAHFEAALAMDSQWLAVGSPGAQRAAMLARGGALAPSRPWTGGSTLTVSPAEADDFGHSMAIADGRLLIGAPRRTGRGAADLFEQNKGGANQWGQTRMLVTPDAAAGDAFGTSVALADYLVLAGMPGRDTAAGTNAGSALLFARNFGGAENYGVLKTFIAPDGSGQSRFGTAVALDTTHAVITAPFADPNGRSNAGVVYVHSRNYGGVDQWGLLQATAPEEMPPGSQFGMAVAMDRASFAAGAPMAPVAHGQGRGMVELYAFRGRTLYDDWAAGWSLHGANGVPSADADGDGQNNLLEYFFGSDPGAPDSIGTISSRVNGGKLIVTFPIACVCKGVGMLTGETSSNLEMWVPATPAQIVQDNASILQIEVPVTVPGRRFVRFRGELP